MKKYIQSSSENENGDVFLQRITKQLGLGRSEASMFIHDVNNLRGDEWLEWVQEECTPEDAKKFEKWYCSDENAYDDTMFSDWTFSDLAEFIAKNFESIAGVDICSIYNPEDENLPMFDDSVIKETHSDIRNFLETHTDWDSTTIDEFYYFLDDYLTSNRSALCGSIKAKNLTSKKITTSKDIRGSEASDLIDWLYEHEQAADDCLNHFKVDSLERLPVEEILGWIYDHDELWEDLSRRFPEEARWFVEDVIGNLYELESCTKITTSKDIDTMIKELSRYRSIQDHVAQIKEAYPGIDGEDLIQFFATESDISDEDAESVLTYLNLV
jgi:hypothetical protein